MTTTTNLTPAQLQQLVNAQALRKPATPTDIKIVDAFTARTDAAESTVSVALFSADRRFAVTKGSSRGRYHLVALDRTGGYRKLPSSFIKDSLVEATTRAKARFVLLALREDVWTVELPGEAAPRLRQLVALRAACVGSDGRFDTQPPAWTERGRRFEAAFHSFRHDLGLENHDATLLTFWLRSEAVVQLGQSEVLGEFLVRDIVSVRFTSPEPSTEAELDTAHAEAVELVLARRANQAEARVALRRLIAERGDELPALVKSQVEWAEAELQRQRELLRLSTYNPSEAATRLLAPRPGLFSSGRTAYTVASELAQYEHELELVEADAEASTVLPSDAAVVAS